MSGITHQASRRGATIRVNLYEGGGKPRAEKIATGLASVGEVLTYAGLTEGGTHTFTVASAIDAGKAAMSPQAMRRLVRTMTEGELRDLAIDIDHAITAEGIGADRAAVIFAVLRRGDA